MNKTIKTRSVIKDVKTLDKHAATSRTSKSLVNEANDTAEAQASPKTREVSSAQVYAESKTEEAVVQGVRLATNKAARAPSKVVEGTKRARELSKSFAQKSAKRSAEKATAVSSDTAKGTIKQVGKTGIKTTSKSVKTAGVTAKTTVKTAQATTTTARGAATGAKLAAKRTMQTTQSAARAASAGVKAAIRAITAFIKLAIAAAKSLTAAFVAAVGSSAAVIIVICLVGLIAVSAFGIFFTGGDMGDGNPTLREVVAEVNEEHNQKIAEIKASNPHDDVAITGDRTAWKEVLAIYSVKTTTDADTPSDVVTLDAKRQQLLREVFWEMNALDSRVEERDVTEIALEDDGNGNQKEVSKTTKVKTLYIVQSAKTSDEAIAKYSFSPKQADLVRQMLSKQYDSAWQSVLYGIRSGNGDIVEIATSQIGNVGGQPYWSWYGFGGRVEWCACFVSWCANEVGLIEAGVVPKFSYCPTGVQWFKDAGRWQERGYEPQPGDIIFFDWGGDGVSDHVGIVESCDGMTVRTIEGNTGDSCARRSYTLNSLSIQGYGILNI